MHYFVIRPSHFDIRTLDASICGDLYPILLKQFSGCGLHGCHCPLVTELCLHQAEFCLYQLRLCIEYKEQRLGSQLILALLSFQIFLRQVARNARGRNG